MNEFLEQFLIESRELVAQATEDLLALERDPRDRARLDGAFRAFHTLKGAAAIVEFSAMLRVTHAAEDLLSGLRQGVREVSTALVSDCLACLDQLSAWLEAMAASGDVPPDAERAAERLIARFARAGAVALRPAAEVLGMETDATLAAEILQAQLALLRTRPDAGFIGRIGAAARVFRNLLSHAGAGGQVEITRLLAQMSDQTMPPAPAPGGQPVAGTGAVRAVRLDAERLDALMRLAGELAVTKNAFGHVLKYDEETAGHSARLQKLQAQLERQTAALLRQVLALRVLPLRQVFERFPRLVREMAVTLERKVLLRIEGEGTEADKTIVEALFEPLLHVLRNAVDHGVEAPAARAAAGKPAIAEITLAARREGDQVVVEVSDDGGGIDLAAVRAVAVARGVLAAEEAEALPDEAAQALIFAPGFSTRKDVTDLSGRGVGMDAVKRAVERLGGRVSVQSRPGQGTLIRFDLPFSMMLSRILVVEAGGQLFGLPFEAVVETVQLEAETIERIGQVPAVALRGRTVPLLSLAGLLGLAEVPELERSTAVALERPTAVVVERAGELAALQVTRLGGQMEVMLRPMDGLLAGMGWVAGTALLGDGAVLIVLEIAGLL
jgi:two-component system chemotaxis sensor kinase CheA